MPEIYRSPHTSSIADLIGRRGTAGAKALQTAGDAEAQRILVSGQAWGNAGQNIAQGVSGTLADYAKQRANAPRQAMEDELAQLRLAVERGKLTQQKIEQLGAEIEGQATRPDGSVDRELLTSLFQQHGIGALLPPVLRELDTRERAVAKEREATGAQLFAATPAGPISDEALQTMNASPTAQPHLRYAFGPGTAGGAERLETDPERRLREAESFAQNQGGVVSPTGSITLPPRAPAVNLRPEDVLLGGKRVKAIWNPQTGRYTRNGEDVTDRVEPIPPQASGGSGPRPLTQTAEAQIIQRLNTQWGAANKPIKELERQVALMDTGMEAVKRGDLAQGAQMVLVTFQKILDPPSVVRESEFMRSAAGQSLMNRVQGAVERLTKGGAGITAPELQKFADLAREAAKAQRNAANLDGTRKRIGGIADRYNIPQELIFDVDASVPDASPQPGGDVEEWIDDGKGGFMPKPKGGG